MYNWFNFLILIFWINIFCFMFNIRSFISLLFYSEIIWIVLYNITIILGTINDDLNLVSFSFFILGLAGLEFAIGFLLIILVRSLNLNLNLREESLNTTDTQPISVNKLFWL